MNKIFNWIKLTWAAIIAAPIIAPLLDALQHRSVLVLIAGLVAYAIIPQIQGLSPMWRDNLGNFVFYGTLLLSGRFTIEGLLKTRGELPTTLEDYLRDLLTELINPTPDSALTTAANTAGVVTQWTSPTGLSGGTVVVAPRPTLPPEQQAPNG